MALKLKLVEAACTMERHIPETELSIWLHETMHLCDLIHRWNSVRNWWCFLTERFVGFIKKFVHNRWLAIESLVSHNLLSHTLPLSRSLSHTHKRIDIIYTRMIGTRDDQRAPR